jgi:hypothetical protein
MTREAWRDIAAMWVIDVDLAEEVGFFTPGGHYWTTA